MNEQSATISRTKKVLNPHSEENISQTYLDSAGKELRSPAFELLGSWAVHIYQCELTRQIEVKIQQRLPHDADQFGNYRGVTEQMVNLSLEECRKTLMDTFRKKKK